MDNNVVEEIRPNIPTKYCKCCGKIIPEKAVIVRIAVAKSKN